MKFRPCAEATARQTERFNRSVRVFMGGYFQWGLSSKLFICEIDRLSDRSECHAAAGYAGPRVHLARRYEHQQLRGVPAPSSSSNRERYFPESANFNASASSAAFHS